MADIVGGAGHQIADALPIVERLAFSEERDIELVTAIPFQTFGDDFSADLTAKIERATEQHQQEHDDRDLKQAILIRRFFENSVECQSDENWNKGVEQVLADHADQSPGDIAFVATHVGDDPTGRTGGVRRESSLDCELGSQQVLQQLW